LFLKEKEVVKHIVGVDMSLYMLERARMKNIGGTNVYDVLLHENVVKYLGKCKDRFDAIFVSGVLYSFRDPSAALSLLNDRLKDQGYLIFIKHSVPISHKGEVYFDHQTDHFFHSKALLSEKLRSYNFALASSADIILSDEQKGELLVFKRG